MTAKKKPEIPWHPLRDGYLWDRKAVLEAACKVMATKPVGLKLALAEGYQGHPLPEEPDVRAWMRDDPELREIFVKAKQYQTWVLADEIIDIAYDTSKDWIEESDWRGEKTKKKADHDHINRARLKIDTLKWIMARMKPDRWGDKVQTEHSGSIGIGSILEDLDGTSKGLPADPGDKG